MGFFGTAAKILKRTITGEVIQRIDTPVQDGWATLSLRLKKERGSGDLYVVLGAITSAKNEVYHYVFTENEFVQFSEAVKKTRDALSARGAKT
jgi:hypothetical protein